MRYVYIGSRTAQALAEQGFDVERRQGQLCDPVRRKDGRVVRCTEAGIANALVRFEDGTEATVSPRRLRLVEKLPRVYLVACSNSKRHGIHPARHLYTGDLFRKSRAYIEKQQRPQDNWYILSARWHALHPATPLVHYDLALNEMSASERKRWARDTAQQLRMHAAGRTRFIFLAGRLYREHLIPQLQAEGHACSVPMRGLGIGQQKAWLLDRTK